jgi:hypothetical protein
MMTLLEAFQKVAPQTGQPEADRMRNGAARILHDELNNLCWSTALLRRMNNDERQEAIAIVLLRLVQAGPRDSRTGAPDHDLAVRRYLRTALENSLKDLIRARSAHPTLALDQLAEQLDPGGSDFESQPDRRLDHKRAALELDQAVQDLLTTLLPELKAGRRKPASERLHRNTEELVAIYVGSLTFLKVFEQAARAAGAKDPTLEKRVRYALYQQYHRVIETLLQGVDEIEQRGKLTENRCRALRTLIGELRLGKENDP